LKVAIAKANDADDFEVVDRLLQQRRDVNSAGQQLLAARDTAIEELMQILAISLRAPESEVVIADALLPLTELLPVSWTPR
jgi:hypothetical protein